MNDLIYTRRHTPVGILVEEIEGGEGYSPKVRKLLSRQIYSENGKGVYRIISHYAGGAPYLEGSETRISISDTANLLVVASLPRTPEVDLSKPSPRTAMGVDAESKDREQVLKVRERFLSENELRLIPSDSLRANVLAWTAKEALLKAGMDAGVDIRRDLEIVRLPEGEIPGEARMRQKDGEWIPMELYSYETGGSIVTIAYSPKCAKYHKR